MGSKAEVKFATFHIDAGSLEGNAFQLEKGPLVKPRYFRKKDFPARTKHTMPWDPLGIRSSKRPCHLTGSSRVPCGSGYASVSGDAPSRYFPHDSLNIVKVSHRLQAYHCSLPTAQGRLIA